MGWDKHGYQPLPTSAPDADGLELACRGYSTLQKSQCEDEVQFARSQFFCTEDRDITIRLMRIGRLDTSCSVKYWTEDGSAKAGIKYKAVSGKIEFAPWEYSKSFTVPILGSSTFDTDLEFKASLQAVKDCKLGAIKSCRVLVIDTDVFPGSQFTHAINQHDEAPLREKGVPLVISYMRLALLSVPGVWWKALLTVIWDQLENAYDIGIIFLRVYLIDVVLHPEKTDDGDLLVKGNRKMTAALLAGLWIGPCIVLFGIERLKNGPWYMGDSLKDNLKVNIFRKYLNYTEESRKRSPLEELMGAIMTDVPDLVENGFEGMFEVIQYFTKIVLTAVVVVQANPKNAIPLLFYPVIIILFTVCRMSINNQLADDLDEAEDDTLGLVTNTVADIEVICDYKQRGPAVDSFEKSLVNLERAEHSMRIFTFQNEQLVPMITNCIVALYIFAGSMQVLDGRTTVGEFIATVNIYQSLGTKFEKIFARMRTWLTAAGSIVPVTMLLNYPTSTTDRMRKSERRGKETEERVASQQLYEAPLRAKKKWNSAEFRFYDTLPFMLNQVCFGPQKALQSISAELYQGLFCAVVGPHASGKASLMKLLMDAATPDSGTVFVPEHLRCLNVSHHPVVLENLSFIGNICFGMSNPDYSRARRICERIGLSNAWLEHFDEDLERETNNEHPNLEWHSTLSVSEKRKVHFARAISYDADCMVMHRPMNHLDPSEVGPMLQMLREFTENRGTENKASERDGRRPRTLFVTAGGEKGDLVQAADIVWVLDLKGSMTVKEGGKGSNIRPVWLSRK
eukprot:TRINITY_DN7217_c0_g1_i1.p1 TRINITY_DN7217_c0_g1~~TRINITY_DN7217_c0_g1_i1.p1  ORF type:complete len:794 (-),score=120.40 TRINITY_DN7217_c0_g1_i1:181-2562(-)